MSVRTVYITQEMISRIADVTYTSDETVVEAVGRILGREQIVERYAADVENALHARGEHHLARAWLCAVEVARERMN